MLAWLPRAATPQARDGRARVSMRSWDTSIRSRCRSSSGHADCTGSGETASGRLHAVDGMDFPQGPQRRVTAPVLRIDRVAPAPRSEEHTSELQSQSNLVCRLLLEKKKHPVHVL